MGRKILCLALFWGVALGFLNDEAAGQVYRYKDENGVVHFTDTPPDDKFTRLSEERCVSTELPYKYRIASVDARFGMSQQKVSEALRQAASIWRQALGRELFQEDSNEGIEINLVYDYRQEARDQLKKIAGKKDNMKSSYNALKSQFENLKADFTQKDASLARDVNRYNTGMNAYNADMDAAYRKGEVPEDVYQRLMAQKQSLDTQLPDLQTRQDELKKIVDTLNSMAVVINDIAANFNLQTVNYNNISKDLGGGFRGGLYEKKKYRRVITIYPFDDYDMLVKVLAHEFGHALGLQHNNNPEAIMHHINLSKSLELAPEDISALKARCSNK